MSALEKFQPPIVTVDMGTATTIGVISEGRNYEGGLLLPGVSLSLDALSQYIHVNKTSLSKEFKAVVGCSVAEYIQLYRFQCACLALSTTDIPVGDIAGQCGFSSGAYFARRFRQVMGMTPLEYRKSRIHNRTAAGGNPPA